MPVAPVPHCDRISAPSSDVVAADVARALAEDLGVGDATASLLPALADAHAVVICREEAVIAGRPWFDASFLALDRDIRIQWQVQEGSHVGPDTVLCELAGNARALVSAERTALNFLQLLSGTATITQRYAAALAGTKTRVLDTRKTVPGLRHAQKYAVRCGGGVNHRIGLYDAILIKENHILAAGSIAAAVSAARSFHPELPLICEVESLDELDAALAAGVDRALLDDFDLSTLREAVARVGGRIPLEASGSVSLERLAELAATGVDFVSVGALTKHVRAVDLSMRLSSDRAHVAQREAAPPPDEPGNR